MNRKILQRYVLWEMASPTVLGLIVFTFVLLATHLFRLTDLLVNRGIPFPLFAGLVGTLLPPLLVLTIPMALLVGVLLGVGRLAADNEIMAMRTSGVHLFRIFVPALLVAVILAAALWQANGTWVPGLVRVNARLLNLIKFIVANQIEPGRVFDPRSEHGVAIYFRHRNPLTQRMEDINMWVGVTDAEDPQKETDILVSAREGHLAANPYSGLMDVTLTSGTMHHLDAPTTATGFRNVVVHFAEAHWRLQLTKRRPAIPGRLARKPREMSNREVAGALESPSLNPRDAGSLRAELQQRRSIPLACVAFMLLGVPLAIRVRPTGKAVAFSIAFGLIFFYYVMLKWGTSLSQNGLAVGTFVTFLPNILVAGVGVLLFYRTLRQ